MQDKLVNFVNEAISINTSILNKSVSRGVESSQNFVQQYSDQAADWLKIKSFDDYVASQQSWNVFAIEQTRKSAQTMTELGNEAFNAYLALWQKSATPLNEAKVVKAKAA